MSLRRRLVFLLLIFSACTHAADLTATLELANFRLRKDAPMPVEVRFQNPTNDE